MIKRLNFCLLRLNLKYQSLLISFYSHFIGFSKEKKK